jgi:hypothetical protein
MSTFSRRLFAVLTAAFFVMAASSAFAADKKFLDSDDAREKDEPQKFLPDYDKLVAGKADCDWVYFPEGGMTKYKTVTVEEFDHTGRGDSRDAAKEGKDYMEQWLEKDGYKVVREGGELTIQGNVFNAWEPSGAARYWGGWAANPGVGLELILKANGKIVGEMRHRAKGSTLRDAVENGLEDMTNALSKGR